MSTQTLTSDAQALVDAVAADLEANVVFPEPYRRHLYLRPGHVDPSMCPLLAVFVTRQRPVLVATGCYVDEWHLGVQWWESADLQVETQGNGDLKAMRLLAVTEAILDRVQAWPMLAIPGISGRYGQGEGEVSYDDAEESYCWHSEISVGVNLEPGA